MVEKNKGLKPELSQKLSRQLFWIKEVSGLKKSSLTPLKNLINTQTKFDSQLVINLESIELQKMNFVSIFQNLQVLDLHSNLLKTIDGMSQLRNIKKLDLSENQIESLKGLENNKLLNELNLSSNKLKTIDHIFHLSYLRILNLDKNLITVVPQKIYKLSKVEQIYLSTFSLIQISISLMR